jgi:hypothetical protein
MLGRQGRGVRWVCIRWKAPGHRLDPVGVFLEWWFDSEEQTGFAPCGALDFGARPNVV